MSSYEERKQARIERYQALADKAARESEALGRQASKMLDAIPPGQPLLVDHYSYNSDKRYRERIWNKTGKSVEAAKKSDYYAAKAEAAERNTAIFSDDPQALEKLKEKLEDLEDSHAFMKQVNAYYRLHKTCHGAEGLSEESAVKIEEGMQYHPWDPTPFPSYALSSSNQEIRRIRERIRQLERDREVGYAGWDFEGGRAVANQEENRLQLFFDEKPPEEQRKELRASGFVFSREHMAWQRKLNGNAIYAASGLSFIQPLSGESPIALQPKPPQREPEQPEHKEPPPQGAEPTEGKRHDLGRFPPGVTVQDLLAELEESYPAVFTNEGMPAYLDALARFCHYSYNNVLLIHTARPDAEHVEGYGTWKALGRNVKRGEHGIKILAPCPIREREEQDQSPSEGQDRKIIKTLFKVTTVFDIRQTEGKEPPKRYSGLSETEIPAFQAALHELHPSSDPAEVLPSAVVSAVRERLEGGASIDGALDFEISAAAYVVCKRYGLPAPVLDLEAMQSKASDMEQMKAALGCVRDTAVSLIESLDLKVYGRVRDRPHQTRKKTRKHTYDHDR